MHTGGSRGGGRGRAVVVCEGLAGRGRAVVVCEGLAGRGRAVVVVERLAGRGRAVVVREALAGAALVVVGEGARPHVVVGEVLQLAACEDVQSVSATSRYQYSGSERIKASHMFAARAHP